MFVSHSSDNGHKMINAICQNFIWCISNYDGTPLHNINLYILPNDVKQAKEIGRLIRMVISQRIIKSDTDAKIIFSRDFNKFDMQKLKLLDDLRLTAILTEDESSLNAK